MTEDDPTLGPAERDPEAVFAVGDPARSWGQLLRDAGTIAARLRVLRSETAGPRGGAAADPNARADEQKAGGPRAAEATARGPLDANVVMLACADRYLGAATLLAIWDVGAVAALPPNGREETIDALCAERGIATLLHDGGGRGGVNVRPWLEAPHGDGTGDGAAPPLGLPRFRASDPIVCLYTSGSTGAHLACPKTAGQLLGEARLLVELFGMGAGTRILATVPGHHIYGLLFSVLVPLMGGGALVRSTPHHAETIAAEARRAGADVLCSVPAHLQGLTALAVGTLPPLRRIFSSGAPLPAEAARAVAALSGTPVTEVLGSSETGGIAWRHGGRETSWRPFPGITVTADEDGAMLVRSPFAGTSPAPGGAHGTSRGPVTVRGADRVAPNGDGTFTLLGRADGVVKIGGSRIALAEVERHLREIPGVRDAAVLAIDVEGLRQHELWAVVAAPPQTTASQLREVLLRKVEPIAVPRRFRVVEALPREENGKLVKARLRALFDGPAPHPPLGAGAAAAVADSAETKDEPSTNVPAAPASPASLPGVSTPTSHPSAATGEAPRERTEVNVMLEADAPFFRGHFAGFPVLPGVVQLNNLVLEHARARWPELGRLQKVTALKFRHPIRPGDRVVVVLERATPHRVAFEIRRAARLMSSGSLTFDGPPASDAPAPHARSPHGAPE